MTWSAGAARVARGEAQEVSLPAAPSAPAFARCLDPSPHQERLFEGSGGWDEEVEAAEKLGELLARPLLSGCRQTRELR